MSRRGDGIRPYKVKDKATGKYKTKFLATVRVTDRRTGKVYDYSKSFDDPKAAKLWRSEEIKTISLGKIGKELERNRLKSTIKLHQLISSYIRVLTSENERKLKKDPIKKGSDEISMLRTFANREAEFCNKVLDDVDRSDFNDYRKRRYALGIEIATVNR